MHSVCSVLLLSSCCWWCDVGSLCVCVGSAEGYFIGAGCMLAFTFVFGFIASRYKVCTATACGLPMCVHVPHCTVCALTIVSCGVTGVSQYKAHADAVLDDEAVPLLKALPPRELHDVTSPSGQ